MLKQFSIEISNSLTHTFLNIDSINAPQTIPIVKSSVAYTPFETLWIPNSSKFVVLVKIHAEVVIYLFINYNLDQILIIVMKNDDDDNKTLKLLKRETKDFGFKCGTFGQSFNKENQSSSQLSTGDFNGNLNIWDLEKLNKPIYQIKNAHKKIINCIDGISGKYGPAEIVTGIYYLSLSLSSYNK